MEDEASLRFRGPEYPCKWLICSLSLESMPGVMLPIAMRKIRSLAADIRLSNAPWGTVHRNTEKPHESQKGIVDGVAALKYLPIGDIYYGEIMTMFRCFPSGVGTDLPQDTNCLLILRMSLADVSSEIPTAKPASALLGSNPDHPAVTIHLRLVQDP